MLRRLFLLTVSALAFMRGPPALAAAFPPHVSDLPMDEILRIEIAFRILERYKFGMVAQARIVGAASSDILSTEELRVEVLTLALEKNSSEVWRRIILVELIHKTLEERFSLDISSHLWQLGTPHPITGHCIRDSMEIGTLEELYSAAKSLAQSPT